MAASPILMMHEFNLCALSSGSREGFELSPQRQIKRSDARHAMRLRMRLDYTQYSVADDRDDVIEIWIAATRSNTGRLPTGLILAPVLAVAGESDNAAVAPYPACARARVPLNAISDAASRFAPPPHLQLTGAIGSIRRDTACQ